MPSHVDMALGTTHVETVSGLPKSETAKAFNTTCNKQLHLHTVHVENQLEETGRLCQASYVNAYINNLFL
jgi:hypothetical protein